MCFANCITVLPFPTLHAVVCWRGHRAPFSYTLSPSSLTPTLVPFRSHVLVTGWVFCGATPPTQGTAHCADMYPATDADIPALVNGRVAIYNTLAKWVS